MIQRIILGLLAGGALGAVLGWVGTCSGGACPLMATWRRGAVWGATLGLLVALTALPAGCSKSDTAGASSGGSADSAGDIPELASLAEFEEKVAGQPGTVVMDFSAELCGACQVYEPIFNKVAAELSPEVRFYKVDVQVAGDLAQWAQIEYTPTTVILRDGEVVDAQVGVLREEKLRELIGRASGGGTAG